MSCGTPQIIMPFSFDQFDNAFRVERLGTGISIRQSDLSHENLQKALEKILEHDRYRAQCFKVLSWFEKSNPVKDSCDIIEAFGIHS